MMSGPHILELVEYQTRTLPAEALSQEMALALWQNYGTQVSVSVPSFRNGHRWELTSQGWVGYIPLSSELHLALRPKVPLANLFHMLEYAYKVGEFLKDELEEVESLQDLYERLALVLAQRVLERARRGLYRAYVPQEEQTAFVRGRLDMRRTVEAPWDPRIHCHFQEHTADVEENRILAWTLYIIPRTPLLTERARPTVLQAFRQVRPFASLEPIAPAQCLGRLYDRLNSDYEPLHALSHFFLESIGPDFHSGDENMVPFLIDMSRLFETFVARWLARAGVDGYVLHAQERVVWDPLNRMESLVDLVLRDERTGAPLYVLDTKYKAPEAAAGDDVYQVVFYAQAIGCHEAVLIYPTTIASPTDTWVGDIHVRTLTFSLDMDLDEAGREFVQALVPSMAQE